MTAQTNTKTTNLDAYYATVETKGSLRSPAHAHNWSSATLLILGHNLGRKTRKQLANALPEELAVDVKRVFWLVHFRDSNKTAVAFQKEVARRAGVSDGQLAKIPVVAVFNALKALLDKNVIDAVADDLSPEISELWQNA